MNGTDHRKVLGSVNKRHFFDSELNNNSNIGANNKFASINKLSKYNLGDIK